MRIAVVGAGGVGGYFGGLLAQAGHEVTFLARGQHLAAMKRYGLQIRSPHGDFLIRPVRATDTSAEIGPKDYVVVCVKHFQLPDVGPSLKPLVGRGTTVVPLLNGVDAHEGLVQVLGPEPVVGGLCSIVSMIESPGVIRQEGRLRRAVIGELDRTRSERVARFVQALAECGVQAIQAEDIHVALWTKFLFIAPFAAVASLSRSNIGEMLACPQTRALLMGAIDEVEAVARKRGVSLTPDAGREALALMESLEPTATTSMQRDVEAGREFELEAFSGAIVRMGRDLSVPTPIHATAYALLRPALERAVALPRSSEANRTSGGMPFTRQR